MEALEMRSNVSDLPRVWWIGVGLLAMAPFHAAEDDCRRSHRGTFRCAISSYILTGKGLSFAREKTLQLKFDFDLLLVSMPITPSNRALPKATV